MTPRNVTEKDAKTYREDLLQAGVGIYLVGPMSAKKLLACVKASGGNPSREVHGVAVEDTLLCGLFRSDGKDLLVLPHRQDVFEAAVDFLRYEAMRHEPHAWCDDLADAIEKRGSDVMKPNHFESGETSVATSDKILRKEARVIGAWGVHKNPDGGGFNVTHTTVGRSASHGLLKKAAMKLAEELASSPYPWRLLRSHDDAMSKEWAKGREFATLKIREAKFGKRPTDEIKAANPSRQLPLFEEG